MRALRGPRARATLPSRRRAAARLGRAEAPGGSSCEIGRRGLGIGLGLALALLLSPAAARGGGEAPALAALVAARQLPPLAERLPARPRVLPTEPEAVYGGELRTLIGTLKDTKLAFVYGYARLVALRPELPTRAGHRRAGRSRRGRPELHLPPAQGPSLVGRRTLHERRLRLLVEPRRKRPRPLARRAPGHAPRRRRDAPGDLSRPGDGAVSVDAAQQPVPPRPGGRVPDDPLPTGALPEAVPSRVQRRRGPAEARTGRGAAQLGGAPQQEGLDVRDGQPRSPDAPAVAPHRGAAGPGLRRGAEPLLPPRGRAWPPAPVHRSPDHGPLREGGHPGQDLHRGVGPPGALPVVRPGPLPAQERAPGRLPGLPLEHRRAVDRGHLPEPHDERSRHAEAVPRPALPPSPLARREPERGQQDPLLRTRPARPEHRPAEPGRATRSPAWPTRGTTWSRPTGCSTRWA